MSRDGELSGDSNSIANQRYMLFKKSDVANAEVLDELTMLLKRNQELDDIFQGLFESRSNGVISDERYEKISASFQNQQTEIEEKIKILQAKFEKIENKKVFPEKFIELANSYGHISELSRETLFSPIDFIEVFNAERNGITHILYNEYICVLGSEIK